MKFNIMEIPFLRVSTKNEVVNMEFEPIDDGVLFLRLFDEGKCLGEVVVTTEDVDSFIDLLNFYKTKQHKR